MGDRAGVKQALQAAVGNEGEVQDLTAKTTLKVVDLNPVVKVEDVMERVNWEVEGAKASAIHGFSPKTKCLGVSDNLSMTFHLRRFVQGNY